MRDCCLFLIFVHFHIDAPISTTHITDGRGPPWESFRRLRITVRKTSVSFKVFTDQADFIVAGYTQQSSTWQQSILFSRYGSGGYSCRSVFGSQKPLVEEEAPLLNTYMSRREQISWSQIPKKTEAKNYCNGEDQQQFNRQTDRQRTIVDRATIDFIARVTQ
jgi:hypothetical protein